MKNSKALCTHVDKNNLFQNTECHLLTSISKSYSNNFMMNSFAVVLEKTSEESPDELLNDSVYEQITTKNVNDNSVCCVIFTHAK